MGTPNNNALVELQSLHEFTVEVLKSADVQDTAPSKWITATKSHREQDLGQWKENGVPF